MYPVKILLYAAGSLFYKYSLDTRVKATIKALMLEGSRPHARTCTKLSPCLMEESVTPGGHKRPNTTKGGGNKKWKKEEMPGKSSQKEDMNRPLVGFCEGRTEAPARRVQGSQDKQIRWRDAIAQGWKASENFQEIHFEALCKSDCTLDQSQSEWENCFEFHFFDHFNEEGMSTTEPAQVKDSLSYMVVFWLGPNYPEHYPCFVFVQMYLNKKQQQADHRPADNRSTCADKKK